MEGAAYEGHSGPLGYKSTESTAPEPAPGSYAWVFSRTPMELVEWMSGEFGVEMPARIQTAADMEEASALMMRISGHRAYLNELLAYAKVAVREAKRSKDKEEWEDMVDRKEIAERFLKIADDSYAALSRAATIKMSNDRELFMGTSHSF